MTDQSVVAFASDPVGVRPGTWAEQAAGAAILQSAAVAVFVPSTYGGQNISQGDFTRRLESVSVLLSRLYGGCTIFPAMGSWVNGSNKLESERIYVAVAFQSADSDPDAWVKLVKAGGRLRSLWRQESLALFGPAGFVLLSDDSKDGA